MLWSGPSLFQPLRQALCGIMATTDRNWSFLYIQKEGWCHRCEECDGSFYQISLLKIREQKMQQMLNRPWMLAVLCQVSTIMLLEVSYGWSTELCGTAFTVVLRPQDTESWRVGESELSAGVYPKVDLNDWPERDVTSMSNQFSDEKESESLQYLLPVWSSLYILAATATDIWRWNEANKQHWHNGWNCFIHVSAFYMYIMCVI